MDFTQLCNYYERLHRRMIETLQNDIEVTTTSNSGGTSELNGSGAAEGPESNLQSNPFYLPDQKFQLCFGFPKNMILVLYRDLRTRISYMPSEDTYRRLPFYLRLLATLSYLQHGHLDHVRSLDAFQNCSKFKLLACVAHECEMIVLFLTPSMVQFPHEPIEVLPIKYAFEQRFGIPGVLGVLDCFFVRLQRMRKGEHTNYTNRHGHTAVNVQLICDHKYRFLDVNARFPGSSSDIYIWKRSNIQHIMRHLQSPFPKTWLVADRGYRLSDILMNPYRNPVTAAQKNLNSEFKEVRSVLDKALGILRARFRCLNTDLPFYHNQSVNVITACVTLHNYLLANGYPIEENLFYNIPKKQPLPNAIYEDVSRVGSANREYIKDILFNNRLKRITASWSSF